MDTLIAGTAIAAQGVLVTHNTGKFSRVKGLTWLTGTRAGPGGSIDIVRVCKYH